MIAVLLAGLLFSADPGPAACLHGEDELPRQRDRRQMALGSVREFNTEQNKRLAANGRYAALADMQGLGAYTDFRVSFVLDAGGKAFMLSSVDESDPCRFAYVTDQSGLIFEARALRPR
jgi:hypothetical protein